MRSPPLILGATVAASLMLASRGAIAGPQLWPFDFDVNLAADPAAVQGLITKGSSGLPGLPDTGMTTETLAGPVKLWLWDPSAELLAHVASSGPGPFSWPVTLSACAKHGSFSIPTVLAPNAPPQCKTYDDQVHTALADTGACKDIEQPEWYVLLAPPHKIDATTTSDFVSFIGVLGEALHHAEPLPDGLLPAGWIEQLRRVLDKLRYEALAKNAADAAARYQTAADVLNANATCFDPAARASLLSSIGDLQSELSAQSAWLDQLKTTGEAQVAKELLQLGAHSRARLPLAHPSLTWAEREWLAYWFGGVTWRCRGGGLLPLGSTQDARKYFVRNAFGLIGDMAGGQDGKDAAENIFAAITQGWGEWMDMGHTPGGNDKYYDLVGMTDRGRRQVDCLSVVDCFNLYQPTSLDNSAVHLLANRKYDTVDLMAGGLEMGPGYYHAYDQLPAFTWANGLTSPYGAFIDGATAIGEFHAGASIALGFARSLLKGYDTGGPPTCTIDCVNKQCGDDLCGGSCGDCSGGLTCNASGQCAPPCTPSCSGKSCGPDSCGGTCGTCAGNETCDNGVCVAGAADSGVDASHEAGPIDSGPDAGTAGSGTDAEPETDGAAGSSTVEPVASSGCGCTLARQTRLPWESIVALGGLGWLLVRPRRGRNTVEVVAATCRRKVVGAVRPGEPTSKRLHHRA
ncbi:MAG: hypothetical protein HY898_14750 [Deltaproteobacteria bacterium]|nr:hypothetical protein [Deltaproteobacteria bacterium]